MLFVAQLKDFLFWISAWQCRQRSENDSPMSASCKCTGVTVYGRSVKTTTFCDHENSVTGTSSQPVARVVVANGSFTKLPGGRQQSGPL